MVESFRFRCVCNKSVCDVSSVCNNNRTLLFGLVLDINYMCYKMIVMNSHRFHNNSTKAN